MAYSSRLDVIAQVLDIIHGFHKYFSPPPLFKEGGRFALPHSLITIPFPPEIGGLKTESFNDIYKRLASMDGRGEFIHTVHLCTLHRQSDDILSDGNPWRISALVDMKHLSPEQPVPSVETGPAIPALLLPGTGAMLSKDGHAPETFMWPELIEHLQQEAQNEPTIKKRLLNCEARRCSDLGFVWAPFVVQVDSIGVSQGVYICSFRLEGGRWLISSLCKTRYTK
ncbi:hypothetical protein DER46DRAFT_679243 [Fusarium sp. MPI-SDFR-AT-0072]|nr:hypothetical protein DER46DRAFT_679243 [Fusarium sp. MPI-SDFR-AT-0072]